MAVGDLDGNGRPDLAVADFGSNSVSALLNPCSGSADVAIAKTDSPDPVPAGTDLTYTLSVSNAGPDAAPVILSDPLPVGTTFQSIAVPVSWICTTPAVGAGGTVTCVSSPPLQVTGADFTLVVRVDPALATGAILTNAAAISSTTPDPTGGNNSISITTTVGTSADLAVTKTRPPTWPPAATPSTPWP